MRVPQKMDLPEQAEVRSRAVISDFAHEREELERVLRHAEISRSPSLVRFLTFICDRFFEGRSKEIREYTIAVEALGRREATFDSQVDPIVRVTARALRKRLREFYENEGKDDPLRIVLPLGHYVPQFLVPTERGAVDYSRAGIACDACERVSGRSCGVGFSDFAAACAGRSAGELEDCVPCAGGGWDIFGGAVAGAAFSGSAREPEIKHRRGFFPVGRAGLERRIRRWRA